MGELWGGGGFSERSPSSPDPFSRRAAGARVGCFCGVGSACEYIRSPKTWLWSRRLTEPPRPANYRPRRGRRFPKGDRKALWSCPQRRNPLRVRRRGPTPHGRGGSVSRRDHNRLAGNRAQLAWAHKSEGSVKPIPSCSSGGSAREGLLSEKPPPSHTSHIPYSQLLFRRGGLGERRFSREAASPPESP